MYTIFAVDCLKLKTKKKIRYFYQICTKKESRIQMQTRNITDYQLTFFNFTTFILLPNLADVVDNKLYTTLFREKTVKSC